MGEMRAWIYLIFLYRLGAYSLDKYALIYISCCAAFSAILNYHSTSKGWFVVLRADHPVNSLPHVA